MLHVIYSLIGEWMDPFSLSLFYTHPLLRLQLLLLLLLWSLPSCTTISGPQQSLTR